MKKTLLLLLSASLICSSAFSMDFYFTNESPFSNTKSSQNSLIMMKGKIESGEFEKFKTFARQNESKFKSSIGIVLSSLGGDIEEAFKISEVIKKTYFTVYAGPNTGKCASACFILYVGAVRRIASPNIIGIHRPYLNHQRMREISINEVEKIQDYITEKTKIFLEKNGVAKDISDMMLTKSSNEAYWLTERDLYRIGKMPPWFEQYAIAKCNYDKELERKVFDAVDLSKSSMMKVVKTDDCIDLAIAQEKDKNFKNLFN